MSRKVGYDVYIKEEFSRLYLAHCSDTGCSLIVEGYKTLFNGLLLEGIDPDHVDYFVYVEQMENGDWRDIEPRRKYSMIEACDILGE